MRLAPLTTVADDSRTMLTNGLARGASNTTGSHQCGVGHCGAAVQLATYTICRFFANAWRAVSAWEAN